MRSQQMIAGVVVLALAAVGFVDVQPTLSIKATVIQLLPVSAVRKARWLEALCLRTFLNSYSADQQCITAYTSSSQQAALKDDQRYVAAKNNICQTVSGWLAIGKRNGFSQAEIAKEAKGLMVVDKSDDGSYMMFKTDEAGKTLTFFYSPDSGDLSFGETLAETRTVQCDR